MKPLNKQSATKLLERIDNATRGELRSISVLGPTTMQLRVSIQDKNRGFDWIDIIFEINGVTNAQLLDDSKLAYVDMADGLSIIVDTDGSGIGVGSYSSLDALQDSTLFITGSDIKYAEADFSG